MKIFFTYLLILLSLIPGRGFPAIYDCFLFFNELEVLEIRLNELYDQVDYFVLVESAETFRGNSKPLYYSENRERFEKFSDKIIHIVIEERLNETNPWRVEAFQRDQIMRGLTNCQPDDIILVSDVDEIVKANTIPKICASIYTEGKYPLRCEQPMYRYYLNARDFISWEGSCATTYAHLCSSSPERLRNSRKGFPILRLAGWHFTSMGGQTSYAQKIESYSHSEHDFPENKTLLAMHQYIKNRCKIVPIDNTFPQYVLDNIEYFRERGFLYPTD